MPRYKSEADVVEVHAEWWDEGEAVGILPLSYGEDQKLLRSVTRVVEQDGQRVVEQDYAEYRIRVMERCIQWVRDGTGQAEREMTMAEVRDLVNADGEAIWLAIEAANGRRGPQAEASFPGAPGDGAAPGEAAG